VWVSWFLQVNVGQLVPPGQCGSAGTRSVENTRQPLFPLSTWDSFPHNKLCKNGSRDVGRPAELQHAEGSEPRQWGMNNLSKVDAQEHRYRDSNVRPSDRKSDALLLGYRTTLRQLCHPLRENLYQKLKIEMILTYFGLHFYTYNVEIWLKGNPSTTHTG